MRYILRSSRMKIPFIASVCCLTILIHRLSAGDEYAFGEGARGFLIRDYNEQLANFLRGKGASDASAPKEVDLFDATTAAHTRQLQATISGAHSAAGRAGPAEFAAIGLPWPDEFLRCANLIDCWEGTLNKLEGSSESEDNFPNVTFGIVGFTSHDGSLQEFLRRANDAAQGAVFRMARERLTPEDSSRFIQLVQEFRPANLRKNHEDFVRFAIQNPKADPDRQRPRTEIAELFAALDSIPQFREIQLDAARKKSWDEELPDYREALFGDTKSRSLQADLFCFDMTVLTNGPGKKALAKLARQPWRSDAERMRQIFAAMKSSPEYRDDEDKRADILERERCIIDGKGEVHDDDYDLQAFALLPFK